MARNLLKQGYELARAGHCDQALSLLARSLELDATAKAALNLARCEEEQSHFGDAVRHWVQARDLARESMLHAVAREASARLAALEARIPTVILVIDPAMPPEAEVWRDGVRLPKEALAGPLPLDPGPHVIEVVAPGRAPRRFPLSLAPAAHVELSIAAGPAESGTGKPADGPPSAPLAAAEGAPASRPQGATRAPAPVASARSGREGAGRAIFWSGVGVGGAGLVVGAVTGIATLVRAGAIKPQCAGAACPPDAYAKAEDARSLGTASNVAFGVAAVGAVTAGVGYWLMTSGRSERAASGGSATRSALAPWLAPSAFGSGASAGVTGAF